MNVSQTIENRELMENANTTRRRGKLEKVAGSLNNINFLFSEKLQLKMERECSKLNIPVRTFKCMFLINITDELMKRQTQTSDYQFDIREEMQIYTKKLSLAMSVSLSLEYTSKLLTGYQIMRSCTQENACMQRYHRTPSIPYSRL